MTKMAAYLAGYYRFKAPPVCTVYWSAGDWVKYIDAYNGWTVPIEEGV